MYVCVLLLGCLTDCGQKHSFDSSLKKASKKRKSDDQLAYEEFLNWDQFRTAAHQKARQEARQVSTTGQIKKRRFEIDYAAWQEWNEKKLREQSQNTIDKRLVVTGGCLDELSRQNGQPK